MKKIIISVFLLSSVCVSNAAMRPEDAFIHHKKNNSEIPSQQRLSSAVPPCPGDMTAYFAAQRLCCNDGQINRSDKPLSGSQELRRCP